LDGQEGTTWTPDDGISKSLWTAGTFTDMIPEDFSNGDSWVPPLSPVEETRMVTDATSACNGGNRTEFERSYNKRPRSPSPLDMTPSAPSAPSHKRHKSSHKRPRVEGGFQLVDVTGEESQSSQHEDLVVQIPLEKVHLRWPDHNPGSTGHHPPQGLADSQKQATEGYRGLANDHRGLTEKHSTATQVSNMMSLVVNIKRSLLTRIPGTEKRLLAALPGRSVVHPGFNKSHDKAYPSHDNAYHPQDRTHQSHDEMAHQSHDRQLEGFPVKQEPMDVDTSDHTNPCSVVLPVVQQRPPPEGVCPGVDGCIGLDGYWYEWTEHILSHDAEVTVMPYVYFEDCDSRNTP
jgi:hypothetical protein